MKEQIKYVTIEAFVYDIIVISNDINKLQKAFDYFKSEIESKKSI